MIGILCPSEFEYRHIRSLHLDPKKAVLICTGMGKLRSLEACHRLMKEHPRLRHLLLIGYAGGLAGLKIGDLIEPDRFIEYDYDARPFEKYPHILKNPAKKIFPDSYRAAILTQDRFLTANPFKGTAMDRKYPRLACDMESYAVAYFATTHCMDFSVMKYISDEADPHAEHDFLKACKNLSGHLMSRVSEALLRL